jgi:alpha-D-ribose 1-methylphosphonate 5-triphosphate diphosphatase
MNQTRFSNARIVTRDRDFIGGVVLADGRFAAAEPDLAPASDAEDMAGDYLIPGLVDLHTDNLERHYEPRPGAKWDALGAVLAHDGEMVSAGITTVFDSLSLHGDKKGFDRTSALAPMIAGVTAAHDGDMLRADHYLHLRCEVTNPGLGPILDTYSAHSRVRLLSVMDHSPAQRQWRNMSEMDQRKLVVALGWDEADVDEAEEGWRSNKLASVVQDNRAMVIDLARKLDLPLAMHDDESIEQVREAKEAGAVVSEFPVTIEAAAEARRQGMAVIMGAPNLIRGGSHSGNVSAAEIARAGFLDAMASDYVPLSPLRAAFRLTEAPFHMPLAQAIATVSLNPARIVGLDDRGEIAPGKRADMVRIRLSHDGWPVVRGVWREGRRVA